MPGVSKNRSSLIYSVLLAGLILSSGAWGQTAPRPKQSEVIALEPAAVGPDYQVQGEYIGVLTAADGTTQPMGAQVVAIGAGAFRAFLLPGGLPGAGWDNGARFIAQGKTQGDDTRLQSVDGRGYSGTVSGTTLSGQNDKGEKFALKKTMRASLTLNAPPPSGALVLFNGRDVKAWRQGRIERGGVLSAMLHPGVKRVGEGPVTQRAFKDFHAHIEFRLPFKPYGRGQSRCNSGVCPQNRYEIQVLDTFGYGLGNQTAEGDVCGDLAGQSPAALDMCFPPLSWQTYDIEFHAAHYNAAGHKTQNARVTVKLNGVVIQKDATLRGSTPLMQPEGPQPGPLMLQDHGSPVVFRNIWLVEK